MVLSCPRALPVHFASRGKVEVAATSRFALPAREEVTVELAEGGHWFGHGFAHHQSWPLEQGELDYPQLAVNNIQCPIWMCSAGFALLLNTRQPFSLRCNLHGDGLLVISSPYPCDLHIFAGPDLPTARRQLIEFLGQPRDFPGHQLLREGIFCTWTEAPRTLTQSKVLNFARAIKRHGFPCSTLIIDDRWESDFGELTFASAFPDPAAMIAEITELGMETWLWVTPFVNQSSATFAELQRHRLLVPDRETGEAALLKWWGGTAGLLDITNPHTRSWLRDRLAHLQKLGVAGFKIDGGDVKYQPPSERCAWHADPHPCGYSDALLKFFAELVPGHCETRTAWLSQPRSVVWRQGGKDSHWGSDNGLQAMITLALQLSLMGYDLQIPDMIPGRVQTMVSDAPLPSDELMVRWTEASALLPIMQFSYAPWHYSPATEHALRQLALLHRALGDYLLDQSRSRTHPLIRPLWYHHPEVEELYHPADEFLLGSDLLAAPVVHPGVTQRDVLLPPGTWIDAWTGKSHTGLLTNFPAPCPGIPLFVASGATRLLATMQKALGQLERGSVPSGVTTTVFQAGLDRDLSVTG